MRRNRGRLAWQRRFELLLPRVASVYERRQPDRLSAGESIGIRRSVAGFQRNRVRRVLGVQMQLAEEGLPQRLVIGARLALFGPPEGRILAGSGGPLLCWN